MAPDPDLLLAVLALKKGLISEVEFQDCVERRASDGGMSIRNLLKETGKVPDGELEALEILASGMTGAGASEATVLLKEDALPREEDLLLDFEALESEFRDEPAAPKEQAGAKGEPPGDLPSDGRYEFKGELGRGALGKVVLAVDRKLNREVAVKFALGNQASPAMLQRFLREGQVAGRLTHPNVVPVYDIGVMDVGDGSEPFFTMAKIAGRDLASVLDDVERDLGDARTEFTLGRLLQIFQDVCHAVAYAHDHGVVHRDLKPANIMMGTYGETYVIDWGLAKELPGFTDRPDDPSEHTDQPGSEGTANQAGRIPQLTMDGHIVGTPAYMSPEQADGRIADIDRRSDICSLGAIRYQILTFRPPFGGASAAEVIVKVLNETIQRPTLRASQVREGAPVRPKEGELSFGRAIPPELEGVCLKALAREKRDRFASASELASEIQKYLDGEKTRERLRQLAERKIEEGRRLGETLGGMREEFARLKEAIETKSESLEFHWPVEKKRDLWDLQRRHRTLRENIVRTFGQGAAAYQEALGFEKDNRTARKALADLYWDQFMREESAGDDGQMTYFAGLVRQYNDGQYDEKLKGDGILSISTRHFTCRCLTEGRMVSPEELSGERVKGEGWEGGSTSSEGESTKDNSLNPTPSTLDPSQCGVMGYHPFSGRLLTTGGVGEAGLEPAGPVRLKVHGPACRTENLEGASAWLFRLEEKDKTLVPGYPAEIAAAFDAPEADPETREELEAALDALYLPDSPFRPSWGLFLGRIPIGGIRVPMGSYLLVLHLRGRVPLRMPLFVTRLEKIELDVTLFAEGEVPSSFVPVPGGAFTYHGDIDNAYSGPKEIRDLPDFFISRFPVTCAEYLEFLNDPEERRSGRSQARVPREAGDAGAYWPRNGGGIFHLPSASWLENAPPPLRKEARRLAQSPVDWEPDWPVMAVSWHDAVAYAEWFSRKTGCLTCLPHEEMWEKAARGTDGRIHAWGNEFEDVYQNSIRSFESGNRPAGVDSFPVDESPYGVRGAGGNATDWCLNALDDGRRLLRGGSWLTYGLSLRLTARMAGASTRIGHANGFRLAMLCAVPMGAPKEAGKERTRR